MWLNLCKRVKASGFEEKQSFFPGPIPLCTLSFLHHIPTEQNIITGLDFSRLIMLILPQVVISCGCPLNSRSSFGALNVSRVAVKKRHVLTL